MRDANAALPIMAISGEAGHLIAAENLGASDTFIKPIDFKRLKSAISAHLD